MFRSSPGAAPAVLFAARTVRGVGAGALSVVLAIDLARVGYSSLVIGALLGLAMGGASVWALAFPRWDVPETRWRLFVVGSLLVATGGFLLWAGLASPIAVLLALLSGGVVASASDISPLGALEQAELADAVPAERRTAMFSAYNFVGYLGLAFGALLAAPISAVSGAGPFDAVFLLYGLLGLSLLALYPRLLRAARTGVRTSPPAPGSPSSRRVVIGLAGLFSVDAFAGGLVVNSLVAYYLEVTFHPSLWVLGAVFFGANLAAALSLLAATPLARRIGLLRTMVFTHLPSSALLIAFAFAPTFGAAVVLWVARATLSQLDVPTRQSYTQAVVPPEARGAAAGYTTAARSAQAFGAPVTGSFLTAGGPWLAAPFVLAGAIKVAYDLALYGAFRELRPPEERRPADGEPAPPVE